MQSPVQNRNTNETPALTAVLLPAPSLSSGIGGGRGGEWAIIHRCKRCGALSSNRVAADDNPMKLMSIAMRPLSAPPFPLERIEEMTALMGGEGSVR